MKRGLTEQAVTLLGSNWGVRRLNLGLDEGPPPPKGGGQNAKIEATTFRRGRGRTEIKIEGVLGEDLYGFITVPIHPLHVNYIQCWQNDYEVLIENYMEEGIWPYKVDHINADTKRKWNRLARKKIDQQIVHGSEC